MTPYTVSFCRTRARSTAFCLTRGNVVINAFHVVAACASQWVRQPVCDDWCRPVAGVRCELFLLPVTARHGCFSFTQLYRHPHSTVSRHPLPPPPWPAVDWIFSRRHFYRLAHLADLTLAAGRCRRRRVELIVESLLCDHRYYNDVDKVDDCNQDRSRSRF